MKLVAISCLNYFDLTYFVSVCVFDIFKHKRFQYKHE